MKVQYTEIASARGKLAGKVATQWHGINILKRKAQPTNPGSFKQTGVRTDLAYVTNSVVTALQDPSIYEGWVAWASNNPFSTGNSGQGNITLPPYQAALKVTLARYQFDLYSAVDNYPTSKSPSVPEAVVVDTSGNKIVGSWPAATFDSQTSLQCWVQGPIPANRSPQVSLARLASAGVQGAVSASNKPLSPDLIPGFYWVWLRVMGPNDQQPSPFQLAGQQLIL